MFTGIVEEVGYIRGVKKGVKSAELLIGAEKILDDIHEGDSIAVNGICLTVTSFDEEGFSVDVMHETLNRSSIGNVRTGSAVNLERAMQVGGRFGGHIVSGHIDGTGVIADIQKDDNAIWYKIRANLGIMRYIIEKGSIAMDGISLTVAKIEPETFSVSVIPHTASHTILTQKKIGDKVNIESDCVGKYVEKLLAADKECGQDRKGLTRDFLMKNGF